jgi:hydroxymethylpyrimidine kinase/phosphomethylpyrimidine kinase
MGSCFNSFVPMRKEIPIALTIAGSDSGGGAGVQADLKTFAALGVHGTSAITCITAQNPRRVIGIEACSAKIIRQQIEAVFDQLPPRAVKTGMLFSSEIILEIAGMLRRRRCPVVVDPVMIATSGARLLKADAAQALVKKLFPLATLVTPNIPEAETLLGISIREPEDLRTAARALHDRFGCAALVKGGHLGNTLEAIDVFFDGKTELMLSCPRVVGVKTHGTGCTYSAAIVAHLARGENLSRAVELAKMFVTGAIAHRRRMNGHDVLGFHLSITEPNVRRK